ncbi:xanthine dehydrogenase family protein molybdopterin-binding subunit [Candidatus Gracilibacteria bacterium]|nr:xanthine dehydrogenase family protein molybdopterin-binding subunit [Candidatus Gracilibacteria bacterium]
MLKSVALPKQPCARTRHWRASTAPPLSPHAQLEPMVGVADVRAIATTIWAPAQAPLSLRDQVAAAIEVPADQVTVIATAIGGGFGRKSVVEAAIEAARLSKAAGRPVKVLWNRSEEFLYGFPQPMTISDVSAALDESGQVVAWDQHLATSFVLFTFFPGFLRWLSGSDGGATRAAVGPYSVPNLRVAATVRELPVPTGTWRGLGLLPNVFASEQFVDELALAAQADPLAFRLRHLANDEAGQRMRRVLERAAAQARWGATLPPDHGRGIACCIDAGTFVAQVVELRVDRSNGALQILKVTAAVDCGLVINPDSAVAQVEGAIVMGLSATLKEELMLTDGRWSATSFAAYPMLTLAEAPAIEVVLIDNRETAPGGLGEPPIGPIAAAVANALANASGARVRTMPLTPTRVMAALADADSISTKEVLPGCFPLGAALTGVDGALTCLLILRAKGIWSLSLICRNTNMLWTPGCQSLTRWKPRSRDFATTNCRHWASIIGSPASISMAGCAAALPTQAHGHGLSHSTLMSHSSTVHWPYPTPLRSICCCSTVRERCIGSKKAHMTRRRAGHYSRRSTNGSQRARRRSLLVHSRITLHGGMVN